MGFIQDGKRSGRIGFLKINRVRSWYKPVRRATRLEAVTQVIVVSCATQWVERTNGPEICVVWRAGLCDNRQHTYYGGLMDNHVSVLNCPSCGAALDLDGTSTVVRCKFCGNVVQISGNTVKVSGAVATQSTALSPALEEIRQLVRGGKMIEAIKRYRAIYNVGLAEAKSAVEALMADR